MPRTHHCLGEPLPHQQANRTRTHPQAESHLWSGDVISHYPQFPVAIRVSGVDDPRVPLPYATNRRPHLALSSREQSEGDDPYDLHA
jgi:hypothetical protein